MQVHSQILVWLTRLHKDTYGMQEQESYPKGQGKLGKVDMNSNPFQQISFYPPSLCQERKQAPPHREGNPIQKPTTILFLQIRGYKGHLGHTLSGLPTPEAMYGHP